MNALHDSTDLDKCLCCGQPVLKRGKPITPERAERALAIFEALGFRHDDLLTRHRAQLDYQSPGFAELARSQARVMNEDLKRAWDAAYENPGEAIPVGDIVVCDDCSVDYTNRLESGGFIFQSKAICPACAPRWRRLIALYGEQISSARSALRA